MKKERRKPILKKYIKYIKRENKDIKQYIFLLKK